MKMVYCATLVLASLATAACSSDKGTGPTLPVSVVGSFALQTINGDTVPTLLSYNKADSTETDVISDVYTFNSDLTYSEAMVVRLWHGSSVTDQTLTAMGTYAQSDASVTITPSGQTTLAGALSGAFLTVKDTTTTLVYHKNQDSQ